jgi:hypothetical protein
VPHSGTGRTAGRGPHSGTGRTAGRAAQQRDGAAQRDGGRRPHHPHLLPKTSKSAEGQRGRLLSSCPRQYKYSQSVQVFSVSTSIFKYVATHAQAGPAYWQPPKELLSRQHPTVKLHQIWCAAYHVTECCLTAEICLLEERRDQLHVAVV